MTSLLWILAVLLVVLGIAGTVLPALPGSPVVFLGLLMAAWAGGFEKVGIFTLVLLGILTCLSLGADFIATTLGAKKLGAGNLAAIGAVAGMAVGLFFGLPGLIIGPFLGAAIVEYLRQRELLKAGKVGLGTWLGLVFGIVMRVALAFTMVGVFLASYVI